MRSSRFRIAVRFAAVLAILLTTTIAGNVALGQSEEYKEKLRQIETFSESFCGDFLKDGEDMEFSAQAELTLNRFISKVISVKGEGDAQISEYAGVLREHLAGELQSTRECKLRLWNDLKNLLQFKQNLSVFPSDVDLGKRTYTEIPRGTINCEAIRNTISQIIDPRARSDTISEVLDKLIPNHPACAEKLSEDIIQLEDRNRELSRIADRYLEAGLCNEANRVVNGMFISNKNAPKIRKIAVAMATGWCLDGDR